MFTEDDILWRDSKNFPNQPQRTWKFSNTSFIIGSEEVYKLDPSDHCRTAIELALFDIHFSFWSTRVGSANGDSNNHNHLYHSHLRFRIEEHFKTNANGGQLTSPPILLPWLWRTFTLCTHKPTGRATFENLAEKLGILPALYIKAPEFLGLQIFRLATFRNAKLLCIDWKKRLSHSGFDIYLPKWHQIAKTTLGVPSDLTHLHCWQMHIFRRFDISYSNTGLAYLSRCL